VLICEERLKDSGERREPALDGFANVEKQLRILDSSWPTPGNPHKQASKTRLAE
jgi:hypothetical protein